MYLNEKTLKPKLQRQKIYKVLKSIKISVDFGATPIKICLAKTQKI